MSDEYMVGYDPPDEVGSLSDLSPPAISALSPFSFNNSDFGSGYVVPSTTATQVVTMQSILEVFQLDEQVNAGVDEANATESEERFLFDPEDQWIRTQRLNGIGSALDQLWWSNSEYMSAAAEKLADGSRDRK